MKYDLGAAGCYDITSRNFCAHLINIKGGKFLCRKYGELCPHFSGEQPWRAKQCGKDAEIVARAQWSKSQ